MVTDSKNQKEKSALKKDRALFINNGKNLLIVQNRSFANFE